MIRARLTPSSKPVKALQKTSQNTHDKPRNRHNAGCAGLCCSEARSYTLIGTTLVSTLLHCLIAICCASELLALYVRKDGEVPRRCTVQHDSLYNIGRSSRDCLTLFARCPINLHVMTEANIKATSTTKELSKQLISRNEVDIVQSNQTNINAGMVSVTAEQWRCLALAKLLNQRSKSPCGARQVARAECGKFPLGEFR